MSLCFLTITLNNWKKNPFSARSICKPVKFGKVTSQRIVIQNPIELTEEGSFLLRLENGFILERFVILLVVWSSSNMKRFSFLLYSRKFDCASHLPNEDKPRFRSFYTRYFSST